METQVAAMMISTRPEWLLPWLVGAALIGATLVVLLGVGLVIGVISILAKSGRSTTK